jgi:hypothetical protein
MTFGALESTASPATATPLLAIFLIHAANVPDLGPRVGHILTAFDRGPSGFLYRGAGNGHEAVVQEAAHHPPEEARHRSRYTSPLQLILRSLSSLAGLKRVEKHEQYYRKHAAGFRRICI